MSEVSPAILNKIKLLLKLTESPNANEAETARAMADKLIAKYNVTEEQLKSIDDKEMYGDNEKLFVTLGIVGWRQQLALAVAKYFDCQIIQEELVPLEGIHQFSYFVYGDDDQVKDVKFVYHAFRKKIENLVDSKCIGRGPVYVDSYSEGVVEAIKNNIAIYGIDIPEIKRPIKKEDGQQKSGSSTAIATTATVKENPTDRRVDVNDQSMIKDIMAYFRGIDDGKSISLEHILELEAEEVSKILQESID